MREWWSGGRKGREVHKTSLLWTWTTQRPAAASHSSCSLASLSCPSMPADHSADRAGQGLHGGC
jgi:hypothetical protein